MIDPIGRANRRMLNRMDGAEGYCRQQFEYEQKRKRELQGVMFMGYGGAAAFAVDAADFDGTNDFPEKDAALTGSPTSDTGIISVWFLGDGTNSMFIISGQNADGSARGELSIDPSTAAATNWLTLNMGTALNIRMLSGEDPRPTTGTWHHLLISWDSSVGTSQNRVYLDDVGPQTLNTNLADGSNLDWSLATQWAIGASAFDLGGHPSKWDGGLAELYFAPGQWLDFSVEANRRKFRSATGKPVSLGTDGSTPTGTAPLIYMHLDDGEAADNFNTNRGSGGAFTLNGALTTRATSPTD